MKRRIRHHSNIPAMHSERFAALLSKHIPDLLSKRFSALRPHLLLALFPLLFLSACGDLPASGFHMHETPQVYVLQAAEPFSIMPTVTLYESGNAKLSTPPISSYGLFDMGHYTVEGQTLTVSHNNDIEAVFTTSDDGDTLTMTSATLGFTKVGAVYRFQSKADRLRPYATIKGDPLTVDVLRELARHAPTIAYSDLQRYAHWDPYPDLHLFDVEDTYTLEASEDGTGGVSCTLSRNTDGAQFPLHLEGATGQVLDAYLGLIEIPAYAPRVWLDFYMDEKLPWTESRELRLPEFPDVVFTWTSEKVMAGEKQVFFGMPVWNVYLADLTNDGLPELCATVSFGSGIVDQHILVYDVATDTTFGLADRMYFDYHLSLEDGRLMVTQTDYMNGQAQASAELRLVNGEIARFGRSVEE